MSQQGLNFGRLWRLEDEYKDAFRATNDALDQVGLLVAAGAAGLDAPTLNKTFEPNSTRHLRLRTVMAIGAVAGVDARRAIITPVARLYGFDLVAAKPPTPEEENRAMREYLARKAPGLLDDYDATRGR